MLHQSLSPFCFIAAIVAAAAGPIWAAVPVGTIKGWQDSAPEAVNITVLSIDKTSSIRPSTVPGGSVTTTIVIMTAKVDVVLRTASGLAPGAVIVLRYSIVRQEPPVPSGPQNIILNAGDRARAYLEGSGKNLKLACDQCLVLIQADSPPIPSNAAQHANRLASRSFCQASSKLPSRAAKADFTCRNSDE